MENKKKSSAKDRLNAKRAKKIGKQQREYSCFLTLHLL
jgi:hypothetical protein